MLYYDVDPHDGATPRGDSCNICCCETMGLRPGETNSVMLNYAAWAVPIGWVVPTFEWSIELDSSSCPDNAIDGQVPPDNEAIRLETPRNTPLTGSLADSATPTGANFVFQKIPLSGPNSGSLDLQEDGAYTYTPSTGFQGWDYFWYEMKDDFGRAIRKSFLVNVGGATSAIPYQARVDKPYILPGEISTDMHMQQVRFPIFMPYSCRPCDSYRLRIAQPAKDCDGVLYRHISCYDIHCRDCA